MIVCVCVRAYSVPLLQGVYVCNVYACVGTALLPKELVQTSGTVQKQCCIAFMHCIKCNVYIDLLALTVERRNETSKIV